MKKELTHKIIIDIEQTKFSTQASFHEDYKRYNPNTFQYLQKESGFFKGRIDAPIDLLFKLNNQSAWTDMVNAAYLDDFLFISEKMVEVLNDFTLPSHQLIEGIRLSKHKRVEEYKLLNIFKLSNDLLDYKKSKFSTNLKRKYEKMVDINTPKDLERLKEIYKYPNGVDIWRISLLESNYDMIRSTHLYNGFYVSLPLKKALETNKITGIKYIPIECCSSNIDIQRSHLRNWAENSVS